MSIKILPGYSLKNKDWAESIKHEIKVVPNVHVVNWAHWETGESESGWIETEAKNIIKEQGGKQYSILAKSAGTLVAMELLKTNPDQLDKVLLCGIPTNDFIEGDSERYKVLSSIQASKLHIIQNKDDNHGPIEEVKLLLSGIIPNVEITSKPRDDHEYPYPEDFIAFFRK